MRPEQRGKGRGRKDYYEVTQIKGPGLFYRKGMGRAPGTHLKHKTLTLYTWPSDIYPPSPKEYMMGATLARWD